MKFEEATPWRTWRTGHHTSRRLLFLIFGALMTVLGALAIGASPAAAQSEGEVVVSCPEGTVLEGTGQNLTCLEITTTTIDALQTADGTFSCRDGSTGTPTAENPTCESSVRNSVRPILTCNGDPVENPGDGDACLIDTDQDGIIDGEDLEPNNRDVGTEADLQPTPAPIVTPTPAPDPPTATPAESTPAPGADDVTTSEPSDDSDTADANSDSGSSGSLPLVFVALGIFALAAIGYGLFRGRSSADEDPDTN